MQAAMCLWIEGRVTAEGLTAVIDHDLDFPGRDRPPRLSA
jgi:hypothetical protein